MTTTIEIDRDLYQALQQTFGTKALQKNFHNLLISAIQSRLEKYNQQILAFEAKYGMNFQEFAKKWQAGEIPNPFGYEVESDYIDWEMLEMEKKDLISALRNLKNSASK